MTISLCIANETDDDRVDLGGVTVDGQTAELNTSDLGRPHRNRRQVFLSCLYQQSRGMAPISKAVNNVATKY